MGRIIFSIISLIAFAVIVVMNIGTVTSFNLFGWQFAEVPVVVLAIVSFVVGALYSFVYYISHYFAKSRKEKLTVQKQQLKSQEQTIKSKDASLKEREKQMKAVESRADSAQRQLPPGTGGAHGSPAGGEPFAARTVGSGVHAARGTSSGAGGGAGSRAGRSARKRSGGWLRNLFGKKTSSGL